MSYINHCSNLFVLGPTQLTLFLCSLYRISIQAFTWYRDSHGLFDYEEKEKLTTSNLKVKDNCKSQFNGSTCYI